MPQRAIVAGGGIGGLSTALALSHAGFKVVLYERTQRLEEFGAGIQLTPNATRVLSRLGALESARQAATRPSGVRVLSGRDDAVLARMDLGNAERRWGAPYLALHRADLQAALAQAASRDQNIDLVLGARVASVRQESDRVSVVIDGHAPACDRADVLVGADGLRSTVRASLGEREAAAAAFTGRVAFRATVDSSLVEPRWSEPEIILRLGPNAHLVHYPLRGGSIVNIVAVIEAEADGFLSDAPFDGAANLAALKQAFAQWSASARRLLLAATGWRAWPLYSRRPIPAFHLGRIALVGDAAHPMVPFLAQGAAQAIEDAGAIAQSLSDGADIERGLGDYSRTRVGRATRVQSEAQRQGRIYHLGGPLALARDFALRRLGGDRLKARYDWLYGA